MNTEIEATFIDIDHEEIRKKLKVLGGKLLQPEHLLQRTIFDYPDMRLDKKSAWVRLRREAESVTLTYKQRADETIDGMKEIELTVDNLELTANFLLEIGLVVKSKQENRREIWELGDCEIMLDTWPWIPVYAEVEGPSEAAVKDLSQKLGFEWKNAIFDSADAIYMKYYDITRTEISSCEIAFGPTPEWLENKRNQVIN